MGVHSGIIQAKVWFKLFQHMVQNVPHYPAHHAMLVFRLCGATSLAMQCKAPLYGVGPVLVLVLSCANYVAAMLTLHQ